MINLRDGRGWILFSIRGDKHIAHKAIFGPAGTPFVPLFKSRRDALEYRDVRLEMPHLRAERVSIQTMSAV